MVATRRLCFLALLFLLVGGLPALAQPAVSVSYERRHDPYTYRFENPSRFDTAELVPHFFEQRYEGDTNGLRVAARYRLGPVSLDTGVTLSPSTLTFGSDIDTFLQPSGDVVTSGTGGDVTRQTWQIRQRVFLPTGRKLGTHLAYSLTRDRVVFHDHVRTVTHTAPPSVELSLATTRETTWSLVHEFAFGVEPTVVRRGWRIAPRAAAGIAAGRLTVQLPDKYPGVDLRFDASVVTASAGMAIERRLGPMTVNAGVDTLTTWSLYDHAQLRRRSVTLSAGLGWTH